jgi:RNA polymerase sigma-B factor
MEKSEEIDTLVSAYHKCKDEKKKRMLHLSIVDAGMSFVKKIALTLSARSGIPSEDLIQVGSIGLIKAVNFFDADKNTKFKTYASYFIKGEIKHYLRDKASIIKPPRGLPKEEQKDILSLDQSLSGEDENVTLIDKIASGDYDEFLKSYENKIMITDAIEKLPSALREIVELSYYEDLNQREISQKLNMSQMQVSRQLKKALNKMYELIKA